MRGISIITICFNQELFIARTIESVITQKNINLQYIIIDGLSKDGTLSQIKKYSNSIDLIISESDSGIYNAINKGLSFVKNDIVGIVHSGDILLPNTLSLILKTFEENDCDVVYGDIYFDYPHEFQDLQVADHSKLNRKMSIFHPSTFIKKSVYSQEGFYDEKFRLASDYDYLLNLFLKNYVFFHLKIPLVLFQMGGMSDKQTLVRLNENFQIRNKYFGFIKACMFGVRIYSITFFYFARKSFGYFLFGEDKYNKLKKFLSFIK
jgi:glycosyltransferase involved in cell wall biosynthesis